MNSGLRPSWPRENAVAVAAAILFVMTAVNGLISVHELTTVVGKFEAVRRSSNTLTELDATISSLRDAAGGERVYVLTGRSEFLEPYLSARPAITLHLRRLDALAADDPEQRDRIRRLTRVIDARLTELDATNAIYRTQGRQAALRDVVAGRSGDLMTAVRRVATEIRQEQERVRSTQRTTATLSSERARITMTVTTIVAALLLCLTLAQISRTTRAEHQARELAETAHAAESKARLASDAANRVKDDFIATVSHELRSPLTAILGWSKILADDAQGEELKEGLRAIRRSAATQKRLIDDLLDVSRITSGKMRLAIRTINVAEVTREGVESMRPAAEARGVKVTVQADERIRMAADPDRLQQIVWNLVSNAVKFSLRGGCINVRVYRSDSHAVIEVIDSGEGIRPEFLPHVFEPFRQADASKAREHKGLGLGLSIVKNLVEAHGGTIRVESAGKGKGTTFSVALPIMPFTRDAAAGSEAAAASPDDDWAIVLPDPEALAGMTILVVDDHQPTLDLLTSVLRRSSANVLAATSAAEGYRLLRRFEPALVLSDIGMPGEDGFTFIDRIRRLPQKGGGSTPAIALTAYVREDDCTRVLASGFQAYLAKPIEPIALVSAILDVAASMSPNAATASNRAGPRSAC
jgi:signal transduction histidine kinase/ActR/RegA family two-component response regulator